MRIATTRSCMSSSLAQAMNAYKNLTKLNHDTKEQECFFPLRVVGLAYELGHKLVHEKGLLQLAAEHLRKVDVSGDCGLFEDGRWRKVRSHSLNVRKQDAELAYTLVRKHLHTMQTTWQRAGSRKVFSLGLSKLTAKGLGAGSANAREYLEAKVLSTRPS